METFLSLFGGRLKEARKGLSLSQSEAADLVGVTREHWGRCERGLAVPGGEVLAALATAGADVRYILTGERDGPVPLALTAEEQTMLDYFRQASKEVRRAALGALLGAAVPAASHVGGTHSQHSSGPGAVHIGGVGNAPTKKRRG